MTDHAASSMKPGELIVRTLLAHLTKLSQKKVELVVHEKEEKDMAKLLKRGEDPEFDQLLSALSSCAEHCLPSLLVAMCKWHRCQYSSEVLGRRHTLLQQQQQQQQQQPQQQQPQQQLQQQQSNVKELGPGVGTLSRNTEKDPLLEKRDLAVDFIYCQVLAEILKQLSYHPGHDAVINAIVDQAFTHFQYKEDSQLRENSLCVNQVADMYAEVVGVLAQSRFSAVRAKFFAALKELRAKDASPFVSHSIISLLMGMKFFRVKMHPIEDFEACFMFLQELGHYFIEVKEKEIKHALAGLLVEILLPVGAVVKNEVNILPLKTFVELLYPLCMDMATKKKHALALFPMVTCLLCVSQKHFFLTNWPNFMAMCLGQLKNRDSKMSRVSLESLFRLLWVYVVRIKCEKHTETQSKLQSIVSSLFPKGSKFVMPRDTPISIFVRIIHFIAQEKLDFAMKEIIFDLLGVNRSQKVIIPERMNIGLCAFLVIAHSLQQSEGDPPMPQGGLHGAVSSQVAAVAVGGGTMRVKRSLLGSTLTDAAASSLGIQPYLPQVRRAFDAILRMLDAQVGRSLLTTNKEKDPDTTTGERKPKLDLFKTCIGAVPRLLPDDMSKAELVELLSRLTVHVDEELKSLSVQAMQNLVTEFPAWRQKTIHGFIQFLHKEIPDTSAHQVDSCLKVLAQLLTHWKQGLQKDGGAVSQSRIEKNALHEAEGLALVMLCQCRPLTRRLALYVLREVRTIFSLIGFAKDDFPCCVDIMDKAAPRIVERLLPQLPAAERCAFSNLANVDFQTLAERSSPLWVAGYHDANSSSGAPGTSSPALPKSCSPVGSGFDPWVAALTAILNSDSLLTACPAALRYAWPIVYERITHLFALVDPNVPNETKASSLLRSGTRKPTTDRDQYVHLWHNYAVFACGIAPSSTGVRVEARLGKGSPEHGTHGGHHSASDSYEAKLAASSGTGSGRSNARDLFKLLCPLLRCDVPDLAGTVVSALGRINPAAFRDALEDVQPLMKEAMEMKQDNDRRKRRRETLRISLLRILELMAQHRVFAHKESGVTYMQGTLISQLTDFLEGMRSYLEKEGLKDNPRVQEIKLNFCNFIKQLIRHMTKERRMNLLPPKFLHALFHLIAQWSGKFGKPFGAIDRRPSKDDTCSEMENTACQAMSALLCCGAISDAQGIADIDLNSSYVFPWLDTLLKAHETKVYNLAQETIVLLLDANADSSSVLEWVIDRCYTGAVDVQEACFSALVTTFNNTPEYHCDYVAMINVALLYTAFPRVAIREKAFQLLQLLYHRFFVEPLNETTDFETPSHAELLWRSLPDFSQVEVSQRLARLHPDLTMPMFSEITLRFDSARPPVREALLSYLRPWMYNLELSEPAIAAAGSPVSADESLTAMIRRKRQQLDDANAPALRGQGWGSTLATDMVLNNLTYATVKFGDEHPVALPLLWADLVQYWPRNLRIALRYLIIITSLAPSELLNHVKRIIVFLSRGKATALIEEMMNELQTIDGIGMNLERTQTPPFFRLTNSGTGKSRFVQVGTCSGSGTATGSSTLSTAPTVAASEHADGLLSSTKRLSMQVGPEEVGSKFDRVCPQSAPGSLRTRADTADDFSEMDKYGTLRARDVPGILREISQQSHDASPPGAVASSASLSLSAETETPHPLPMPAYGGHYAPLHQLLPDQGLPNSPFYRSSVILMLMTDLALEGPPDIDWGLHLPCLLHFLLLGMDHSRPLVHEHCKRLLLNLLRRLCPDLDDFRLAALLSHSPQQEPMLSPLGDPCPEVVRRSVSEEPVGRPLSRAVSALSVTSSITLTPDSVAGQLLPELESLQTAGQVARTLCGYLLSRRGKPLWQWEDMTPRSSGLKSASELELFLLYVTRLFRECPLSAVHLEHRWAQVALQVALSCSSRHYAARSLQLFRALHVPLCAQMLGELLTRLIETVAEQNEDAQGYVVELMLTLEAAVDHLNVSFPSLDFTKEHFLSTPNLSAPPSKRPPSRSQAQHAQGSRVRARATTAASGEASSTESHARSTSYAGGSGGGLLRRGEAPRAHGAGSGSARPWTMTEQDIWGPQQQQHAMESSQSVTRCRSPQALAELKAEDKLDVMCRLFWAATALLESDYEYEFQGALRLLEKLLRHIEPERPDCRDKLDRILRQMDWPSFPGLLRMLMKGCTHGGLYEPSWRLLARLVTSVRAPVVDPGQSMAFPILVLALLPYLVTNYESPNDACVDAAKAISQVALSFTDKLENLATVMNLYSRNTFSKDSHQWTKCVVKYLLDVYANVASDMLIFVVELLDRGPVWIQSPLLKIVFCLLHYVDLSAIPSDVNVDVIFVVTRLVEGTYWRESLKILKQAVSRSSTLTQPPQGRPLSEMPLVPLPEAEPTRLELPGRTLDVQFDVGSLPLIAEHLMFGASGGGSTAELPHSARPASPAPASSGERRLGTKDDPWKKPWLSQGRTRERLHDLLSTFGESGQRIGLPKSPSVIFSQSTETIDAQPTSANSSSETTSTNEMSNNDDLKLDDTSSLEQAKVFRDLDRYLDSQIYFLDLGDDKGDDSKPPWGVRKQSITHHRTFLAGHGDHTAEEEEERDLALPSSDAHVGGDTSEDELSLATSARARSERGVRLASGPVGHAQGSGASGASATEGEPGRALMTRPVVGPGASSPDLSGGASNPDLSCHASSSGDGEDEEEDEEEEEEEEEEDEEDEDEEEEEEDEDDEEDTDVSLAPCTPPANLSEMLRAQRATPVCQGEEVEELWGAHIQRVMGDHEGSSLHSTYRLFPQVYREVCAKVRALIMESKYYLCRGQNLRSMTQHFDSVIETIIERTVCPFVFVHRDVISSNRRAMERQKLAILQLHESYETYIMRRDQTIDSLDEIRHSLDLQTGETRSRAANEKSVRLCRFLHKLLMQCILLFECFLKVIEGFRTSAADFSEAVDVSEEWRALRQKLRIALEAAASEEPELGAGAPSESRKEVEAAIHSQLAQGRIAEAVRLYRRNRSVLLSFGAAICEDERFLLHLQCEHESEARANFYIQLDGGDLLKDVCTELLDEVLPIAFEVDELEREVKARTPPVSNL